MVIWFRWTNRRTLQNYKPVSGSLQWLFIFSPESFIDKDKFKIKKRWTILHSSILLSLKNIPFHCTGNVIRVCVQSILQYCSLINERVNILVYVTLFRNISAVHRTMTIDHLTTKIFSLILFEFNFAICHDLWIYRT